MIFLVPEEFKEDVRVWINNHHTPGKRSKWFPFHTMSETYKPAIMANIEPEDALMFALTFEHEKMDKE